MKREYPKWWGAVFLSCPVAYFILQFLPYYHSGGADLPSLGSLYWFPAANQESIGFISLFHYGFRVNDLTGALLTTQLFALFLIILSLAMRNKSIVAFLSGAWGLLGLFTFLTTRPLSFSPVMVYGGIAGILMLLVFLASVVLAVLFYYPIYKAYRKNLAIVKGTSENPE